jgi:hypothetical protein
MTLLQSSQSNDYLSAMEQKDAAAGDNLLALAITDLNGETLMSWNQAWVEEPDSWGYGGEVTDRAWVFHTGQVSTNNKGGNSVG